MTPKSSSKPFIFVPLYIYPTSTSWLPLLNAAATYPELAFKVVVNPDNGPGQGLLPDANYLAGLQALAGLTNVQVLGYVYCNWGQRSMEDLERDILTYAHWLPAAASITPCGLTIRIDGIFIDEAPADVTCEAYMATAARFVRTKLGSNALVVFNPGLAVDAFFYQVADYVIVFENRAAEWASEWVQATVGPAALDATLRRRSIVVAHSCATGAEQAQLARELGRCGLAGQLVTTESEYTAWCPHWAEYLGGLIALAGVRGPRLERDEADGR
jgi:hypothetical protein